MRQLPGGSRFLTDDLGAKIIGISNPDGTERPLPYQWIDEVVESRSVKEFGAKCDAFRTFGGGSTTAGGNIFTGSGFTAADVGKLLYVPGANTGGTLLQTSIVEFISATSVRMANSAVVAVSNAHYLYGSDDSQAWQAAYDAVADNQITTISVPYGFSLTDGVKLKSNMRIIGAQSDGWAFKNYRRATGLFLKPGSNNPGLFYPINGSVGNVEIERICADGLFRFHKNAVVRYSGATTTAGSNTVNFTNGSFTSADIGKKIAIFGAGGGGSLQEAAYVGIIRAVASVNQITVDDAQGPATLAKSDVAYAYGFSDLQGVDGATTAASTTFTAASASFTAADVGKVIEIYECMLPEWGDGTLNKGDKKGEQLVTHIVSVTSATQVVLHVAPELTATNLLWRVGAQSGIYQPQAPLSQDSMWHINQCVFNYFPGNGYSCGLWQRAQRIYASYFWQCLGHGMWIKSSDNTFIACHWANCGEDGFQILQSTNHFLGGDTFNNEGNGGYIGGYGGQTQLTEVMFDTNGKNGLLDFGTGTVKLGCRWTSNSQRSNGMYNDFSVCRRYMGGVTNLNTSGNQMLGGFWAIAGNGNKPAHGIDSVGPYGIRGTGVNFNPDTSPFTVNSITSSTALSLGQVSTTIEGGNSLTFMQGNTINFDTTVGTKIGNTSTQKLSFWGATPIVRPTITGSRGGNAALASLLTQGAAIGLWVDSTTA